ncbi:MAG: hypothetical protein D3916_14190 [Candidatus Electrothrix sp. MAN1_4]|nr:hypothetical protein [Candidatus Electrothrix sp. MAN1_4]
MWKDPIVEEVRRLRDQYAGQLGYNIQRIFQDIQKRQALEDKKTVSFPPRSPITTGEMHNVLDL